MNMKTALLVCLVLALALVVPSRAESCKTEPERCKEGQCCMEFGMFGTCRPLREEGEMCTLRPIKSKHVYFMMCPCQEGLTCEEDDSGSSITGKCVQK